MAASATSANSGGKTHSPVTLPMSVQPHHQQQQQHQQQHHMQAIPSSAAAAAAAAVAAAAQLAAAAQMTNGSGSRLLQAPPPTSSPHEPLQPTQQTQLAPLPSWAYGHPALLPVDPQTESLTENWRQFQQAAYNYNLDPHMLAAMYGGGPGAGGGGIGFGQHPLHHHHHHHHPHHPHPHRSDLSARRKNATRETTSILKAWLNEHKKNPYPTKGEKIMLAIITTMTLTQVSTWFANARRRLKKENKMTWVPRNRPDEEDDDEEDAPSTTAASAAAAAAIDEDNNDDFDEDDDIAIDVGGGGALDADNDEDHLRPKIPMSIHGHQSFINQRKRPIQQLDETAAKAKSEAPSGEDPVAKAKPRIWSIVDTLNKTEPRQLQPPMLPQTRLQIPQPLPPLPPMPHQFQHHGQHLNQQSTFGFFGQHPKLPMTAGHQCGMQPPPPPPPPHHQLLMPPLYYSLFNAFNNRPTPSAAAAAATAAFGDSSPEPKCSPALDQPTGI